MMSSQINPKEVGERLHRRLLADSSLTVTSEIAEEFLPLVTRSLARAFPNSDQHLVETAVEDALLAYFDRPEQFDPTRSSLFTYLQMRAKGYLLNSLGQQKRFEERHKVIELDSVETVYKLEAQNEMDAEAALIERHSQAEIIGQLREIITDPTDLQVVTLMIEGVRETRAFAEVLGITDHSAAEQAKLVKQCKDRLKKTLHRKLKHKGKRP